LDTLRLQFMITKKGTVEEDAELENKLQSLKIALEATPSVANLNVELQKLDKFLLQISEMIIMAAKIEHMDDELRDQTIMAFKADTTTERWDQVRLLTSDEDWGKIKEELVIYVLKQNTNVKEKIGLLIKDGLYKQVIEIFPKPVGDDQELELLLDVYKTIEEKESGILERLIPVVARYMKRYFQEQKYNVFYPILDRLQRRFSGLILPLLSHATDMVMLEIVPSQYHPFVHMLQGMKARLELLQRHDDWTTFFVEFKKKHKGKKKLISMVETIGDSIWSIETILPPPTASQKRRQKKDKSQTTKTKPPKAARNKRRKKGQLQPISLPTATTDTSIQDQPPSATPFSFGQPSFAVGQPTPIPPPILTMPDKKKK